MDPRGRKIIEYLREHSFASADDLARALAVSAITIRRDLDRLDRENLLRRVHGGAVLRENDLVCQPISERVRKNAGPKRRLAAYAAALIRPDETVFLDAGSTCRFLAELVPENMDLTIITHSLDNVNALRGKSRVRTICVGGELDPALNAFLGPLAEAGFESFSADRAFIGTSAVDARNGCGNNSVAEKRIKTLLNGNARQAYVLADATKFGQRALFRTLPASSVRSLITGASAPREQLRRFREKGVEVHLVPDGG